MDAAMAAPDSTLTPTVIIPSRATHTVIPANMTARPAVPAAVTTASWTLSPRRIAERTRGRLNSGQAMPAPRPISVHNWGVQDATAMDLERVPVRDDPA